MALAWLAVGGLGMSGGASAGLLDLGGGVNGRYDFQFGHKLLFDSPAANDAIVTSGVPGIVGIATGGDASEGGTGIANRLSASLAVRLHRGHYGLVVRGHAHDERTWSRPGHADSAPWQRRAGHPPLAPPAVLLGRDDAELQEAYFYSHWQFVDGLRLRLRAGRQRVNWAQSVFSAGLTGLQGTLSPVEAALPGVDLRDSMLAVDKLAVHLGWNDALGLSAYYRPYGVQRRHAVPVAAGMDWTAPPADFLLDPVALGRIAPAVAAVGPDDFGRWGAGLRYRLGPALTLGGYFVRYAGGGFSTPAAPGGVVSGHVRTRQHAGNLYAASLSTHLGPVALMGQTNFRDGARLFGATPGATGLLRGQTIQTLVSASHTWPMDFLSSGSHLTGEAGYMHVNVAGSLADTGAFDASASGFQSAVTLTLPHFLRGWDARFPLTVGMMEAQGLGGGAATPGAFGASVAQRLGFGARFSYLSRIEIGIGYSVLLDSAGTELPAADMDSVAGLSLRYAL